MPGRTKPAWNQRRVRKRIAPVTLESPRGYLCRVAGCFSYASPTWLTELADFTRADDLELAGRVNKLAYVLRLDPDEWRSMLYLKVRKGQRFWRRQFLGQLIAANRLNYGAPRICPACLQERPIWWGIWDLAIVSACPDHRCELTNICPHCGEQLSWCRPGVELCSCGFDLREVEPVKAEPDVIAMIAMVYQSAGFPVGSFDLRRACFSPELQGLGLDNLIGLILAVSVLQHNPRQPQQAAVTHLSTAQQVARDAADVLRDWPSGFHDRLRALLPTPVSDCNALTFRGIYGDFYQFLLDAAHQRELKFLIEAFGDFVARDWPGVIRGQHRLFPQSTRDKIRWIPAMRAASLAGLPAPQMIHLARNGKLTGIFVSPPKSRGRVECWLDRERLAQWIVKRDSALSYFVSQAAAMKLLGLTTATLRSLVQGGLIEMWNGTDRGFPPGVHVCRQHVETILAAFSNCPSKEAMPKDGKAVLLREAMRRHLGRESFSKFVRHVLDGTLQPVARDSAVVGILGYKFRIADVKRYVPSRSAIPVPSGSLTYGMAAAALNTNTEVVRNLAVNGLVQRFSASGRGIQLVSARDVEDFAASYVALKSIADRFDVGSRTVSETLKRRQAEVLVIPLPGKGNKLFARRGPKLDLAICGASSASGH